MRLGITHKLFFAILLATTLAVIASTSVMQWSINRGFLHFINAIETEGIPRMALALEEEYEKTLSWDGLKNSPMRWLHIMATTLPHQTELTPDLPPPLSPDLFPPPLTQQFDRRIFLLDENGAIIIGPVADLTTARKIELHHRGKTVGFLGLLPNPVFSSHSQQQFMEGQRTTLVVVAVVVIILSALLSLLLARKLVKPITLMADVTRKLAFGSYGLRVAVTSDDELGQLARDLNSLALSLGSNEGARRQLVQDLSHEFRTPLTFLRSQIEALMDGVRQPDQQSLQALHTETARLGRLVDDIYQLSLSDIGAQTYRKEDMDLVALLSDVIKHYTDDYMSREITLVTKMDRSGNTTLFADPARLRQLFTNLLDNTLKYTDRGGRVEIETTRNNKHMIISILDSPPGVANDDLPRLFERLFRVESSRNRLTGGSGLGLSICRKIVEAHEGTIEALPSPLGGVWIKIELPFQGITQ